MAKSPAPMTPIQSNGMASTPMWLTEWGFDMAVMTNQQAADRFTVQLPLASAS